MHRRTALFAALLVAALGSGAAAAGHGQKMKMDQPMATRMMKKGMTQGDVRKAAKARERRLAPVMEQEEKSMPKERGRARSGRG